MKVYWLYTLTHKYAHTQLLYILKRTEKKTHSSNDKSYELLIDKTAVFPLSNVLNCSRKILLVSGSSCQFILFIQFDEQDYCWNELELCANSIGKLKTFAAAAAVVVWNNGKNQNTNSCFQTIKEMKRNNGNNNRFQVKLVLKFWAVIVSSSI